MENIKKPNFSILYANENNDLQMINDEYNDTFFYLEDFIIHSNFVHKINVLLNSFELIEKSKKLDKEINRVNNTLKLVKQSNLEQKVHKSNILNQDILIDKLINILQNNLEYYIYLQKQIKNIEI